MRDERLRSALLASTALVGIGLVGAAAVTVAAVPAVAADLTWDPNPGNANWSITDPNWSNGALPKTGYVNGSDVTFNDVAQKSVTVVAAPAAPLQVGSIDFTATGYSISGGFLGLSRPGAGGAATVITVAPGATATISSTLTNGNGDDNTTPTNSLEKTGEGTLILRGGNSYTGTTLVSNGQLISTGTINAANVATGGSLVTSGSVTGGLANAGTVAASGFVEGNIVNRSTGTFTVTGDLVTSGTFFNRGGTLAVTGGNLVGIDFTQLDNGSGGGQTALVTVGAGRTLAVNGRILNRADAAFNTSGNVSSTLFYNSGTVQAGGTISGPIRNQDTGTFTTTGNLVGNNTFLNGDNARLIVSGGTAFRGLTSLDNASPGTVADPNGVRVFADGTLDVSGAIRNRNGATFRNDGTVASTGFANAGSLINTGGLSGGLTNSGSAFSSGTISGGLTNTGTVQARGTIRGPIINRGAGTFTTTGDLVGDSSFLNRDTARLIVSSGTAFRDLTFLDNGSAGTAADPNGVRVAAGGTLDVNGRILNREGATFTTSGNVGSTLLYNSGSVQASGTIRGPIRNEDAGTFTTTGNLVGNNTFLNRDTARLFVAGGTTFSGLTGLDNGSAGTAADPNGVRVAADGRLDVNGLILNRAGATFVNDGTVNDDNTDLSSRFTNAGSLINNGTLTVRQSPLNNSGTTANSGTINGGVANSGNLGTSGTINGGLTNTGTVQASGTIRGPITNQGAGTFTTTGNLVGDSSFLNRDTARLFVAGGTTFSGLTSLDNASPGTVLDPNGVRVAADGRLDVNGLILNRAGATFVNDGTVNDPANPNPSTQFTNAGRLINNGTLTVRQSPLNNSGSLTTSGTINGGLTNTGTVQARGTISGPITNQGAGTFTTTGNLVGDNSFLNRDTARLIVSGGTAFRGLTFLDNGSAGTLADPNGVRVAAGGTLDVNGRILNQAGATFLNERDSAAPFLPGTVASNQFTNAGSLINNGNLTVRQSRLDNRGSLTNSGTINGGLDNFGNATNTGTINNGVDNRSSLTNSGTINNGAANSGNLGNSGTINGGLANFGSATNSGTINNGVANSGNLGNSGTINGGLANFGSATNTGTINGGVGNSGNLITSNTINGGVFNIGTVQASGTIRGPITNQGAGTFTTTGNLVGDSSFLNRDTARLIVSGATTFSGLTSLDNVSPGTVADPNGVRVAAGGTLDVSGPINNRAGATFRSDGTVRSTRFDNDGTLFASGVLAAGTVANGATGTFNLTGNLAGPVGTLTNNGRFNLASSSTFSGITTFDNNGTVGLPVGAGTTNATIGAATFNNNATGQINLSSGSGSTLDMLTLAGNYNGAGGSKLIVDADLTGINTARQLADRLTVTGNAAGQTTLDLNRVGGTAGFVATPITVARTGNGNLALAAGAGFGSSGFVNYEIQRVDVAGGGAEYRIVSNIDTAKAASTTSSIAAMITSLNVGFFQSISAFISGPAEHRACDPRLKASRLCTDETSSVGLTSTEKSWSQLNRQAAAAPVAADANDSGILPNTTGFGLWARGSGGETTIRNTSVATVPNIGAVSGDNRTRISFAGFQVGADAATFNINNSGFNVHMGLTAGEVYANGKALQNSQATGVFNVPFIGVYAALTSGPFTSDVSYRHDYYNARINDFASGVANVKLPIGSDTVAASAAYRFDLPNLFGGEQTYFFEPSGSISYTKTTVGTLPVQIGSLSFQPIDSILGRVGFRAGTTLLAGDKLALQPFVTASVWNEFAGSAASRFTASNISTDPNATIPILTNRVGTFGQFGVGLTGQLLGTDLIGYVRGDVRVGERLEGYSVNGGVRYPF